MWRSAVDRVMAVGRVAYGGVRKSSARDTAGWSRTAIDRGHSVNRCSSLCVSSVPFADVGLPAVEAVEIAFAPVQFV